MGTQTPEGAWSVTGGHRKTVRQLWEDYTLLSSSVVSARPDMFQWEPQTPEQEKSGVRVGSIKIGRGVTTFPAPISSLTLAAAFACMSTDIDAGLIPASAIERLTKIAEQLEREAEMQAPSKDPPTDYVRLDQIAAIVKRSKRTLEDLKSEMPSPKVRGGHGKPAEWSWSEIRPWLEQRFDRPLPERFPFDRFH